MPRALLLPPSSKVDQDPSADDALFLEVVDAEKVLGPIGTLVDVIHGGVVIEELGPLVAEVAEPIPLGRGLRIE